MKITGIKALTFDTFGTVVDWRKSIKGDFQAFSRRKKLKNIDWEALIDEWKTCYRPGMDAVNSGRSPWQTIDQIYRRKLDEILSRYGLGDLDEEDRVFLNRAWHRLKPWPDAVAGLRRIKKKYVISPLSNGDVACLVNMAKFGGLPWDLILCGELFKRYKPAPEVYLGAIAYLGLRPHEVMMVAAHNYDLKHARSHGMRTGFVARPTEYGPGQQDNLRAEEDWDIIAKDFGELAAALGA
ncbi:MAG: haloacid dehalogenase type II [Betaproteobacteria bacterium]|nr:haloacid dehalogenase type II [Betaproteobacteria bacterium]MDH3437030.1 haloacid dehalogenase type II [Betaproteobacteria bacterium]